MTDHQVQYFKYHSQLYDRFDNLQKDQYLESGTRYRALSTFEVGPDGIEPIEPRSILQDREGLDSRETEGIKRVYQPIDTITLLTPAFQRILYQFASQAACYSDSSLFDVHQIRIKTDGPLSACVAPEGPHRDCVDYVGIFHINRINCHGGEAHLYDPQTQDLVVSYNLTPGLWLLFDDRKFLHYGTPIRPIGEGPAILDFFVFTSPSLTV